MFENIKGMAGLAGLMKDLPRIQEKMMEVKDKLDEVVVEAETGGGAVRVKANGQLRILSLHVDPTLIAGLVDASNPDDLAMAEDLIVGAVNAALDKARQAAEKEMQAAAQEMGLPIPPGSLGGMLSA